MVCKKNYKKNNNNDNIKKKLKPEYGTHIKNNIGLPSKRN